MKKLFFLTVLVLVIAFVQAQNYQIDFAGKGASNIVDSVRVENLTLCTDTILRVSDNILHLIGTVGINESNFGTENILQIYPNPNSGTATVDFEAHSQANTKIALIGMCGKTILQTQEFLTKGNHRFIFNRIKSGVYFLRIESEQYSYTAKIISCNPYAFYGVAEIQHIETVPYNDEQSSETNTSVMKIVKGGKSVIDMQYNTGDILKLTGISGIYRTVFMLIPTKNQTVTFNFMPCTDADNNHYTIVTIGSQTWMEQNIRTTKYNDGTPIPLVSGNTAWGANSSPAYCWYNNIAANAVPYGGLYNWYVVDSLSNGNKNLCPIGWHVPTDTEWRSN